MGIRVVIEDVSGEATGVPVAADLRRWVRLALKGRRTDADVSLRIVSESEIQQLNRQYRHKNKPTNVLSFPSDVPPDIGLPLLGDVLICASVVAREASVQGKSLMAHWAHLVIHGCLHLLGFDHETPTAAAEMEPIEIELLARLGYPDPYR